ncbi:3-oxoacyl-[acyl-carrier-protein] reductase FabG-like [Galleria mellonella]|uniref:3-oxoacyl-[acyl-carrier-protein] reductase FabG-like n=1 Tax=Galleria mellonella TaxID=7137 RepID=A0A6J1WNV0_GALME|nr:3-oxoacyl-[acyl-carrier-protein] reductase FabG-like [Galleria mellonella]
MSFNNKVVIVTGASSGIGAATAVLFAKEGARVVMVGRNESKLSKVVEQCARGGHAPLVIRADVANDDDVKRIVDETINKFGKIDVLVNNAGMGVYSGIMKKGGNILKAYDETMAVNMRAVVHLTTLVAPHLVKTKGNIVNISSIVGKMTPKTKNNISYSVSKAALDHFTRGAALELAASGVRVNAVSPGPVRTDFLENAGLSGVSWDNVGTYVPLKRCSEPEEIAEIILYLASDKAKGITGSDFVSDNGSLLQFNVPQ